MAKRLQRKIRSAKKLEGWKERTATRSKYARKLFKREEGRDPKLDAYSNAKKKGMTK